MQGMHPPFLTDELYLQYKADFSAVPSHLEEAFYARLKRESHVKSASIINRSRTKVRWTRKERPRG